EALPGVLDQLAAGGAVASAEPVQTVLQGRGVVVGHGTFPERGAAGAREVIATIPPAAYPGQKVWGCAVLARLGYSLSVPGGETHCCSAVTDPGGTVFLEMCRPKRGLRAQ